MSQLVGEVESTFESRGFLWVVIIGSAGGIALTVANAIEYNRARTNCDAISSNTANVLLWLNIILAVVLAIIFIWAIYRLVVHPKTRAEVTRAPTVKVVQPMPAVVTRVPVSQVLTPTSGAAAAQYVTPATTQALQAQVLAAQ